MVEGWKGERQWDDRTKKNEEKENKPLEEGDHLVEFDRGGCVNRVVIRRGGERIVPRFQDYGGYT